MFHLTGLDIGGQKVQSAAKAEGKDPQVLRRVRRDLGSVRRAEEPDPRDFVDFVRSTRLSCRRCCRSCTKTAFLSGRAGFYSARQETFLTEKDRRDGTFEPIYGDVTELVEHNYYFKLGEHQQWLIDHIEANPGFFRRRHAATKCSVFSRTTPSRTSASRGPRNAQVGHSPAVRRGLREGNVWFDALSNNASILAALRMCRRTDRARLPAGRPRDGRRTFTSWRPQVPRRLLADHAQGDGAASARAGPRLVAEDGQK